MSIATHVTDELLQAVLSKLGDLPSAMRQTMVDHEWASIPFTVDAEFGANQALQVATPLLVTPQTSGLELITSIVVSVPAGATGVIQLGSVHALPVPAGLSVIAPISTLLASTDVRSLTLAGAAGPAALWLMGRQQPTYGVLAK